MSRLAFFIAMGVLLSLCEFLLACADPVFQDRREPLNDSSLR